jgi:hypothetical protein
MKLNVNDIVQIRRTNGSHQIAKVKYIHGQNIHVIFADESHKWHLRGPMKPEEVILVERNTIGKSIRRKLLKWLMLLLMVVRLRSKYVLFAIAFIVFTFCFLIGIKDNYILMLEKHKFENSGFLNVFRTQFIEPASIWKAILMTVSDIPRAVMKLFGYVLGDFTYGVFSNSGTFEKLFGTLALVLCIIKLLFGRFCNMYA